MKKVRFFQQMHDHDKLRVKADHFGRLLHALAAELKDIKGAPLTYTTINELINVFNNYYTQVFMRVDGQASPQQLEHFIDSLVLPMQIRLDVLKIRADIGIGTSPAIPSTPEEQKAPQP